MAVLTLIGSANSALASSGYFDPPSMIEVGGGAGYLGNNTEKPIEAVFRVEAVAADGVTAYQDVILARISGLASAGLNGVSYIDFHLESIGWQAGDSETFGAITFLNLDLQRNIPIGQALSLRVTFLGVRGELSEQISDKVIFSLKGAIDMLGVGYTRRTDGEGLVGLGTGLSGEIGFKFFERFRIAIGEEFGMVNGKPETYFTGYTVCDTYYDDWGYSRTYCHDETATRFRDNRFTSNTYLSLAASITENISVFGQASYNLYVVSDDTGDTRNSSKGTWQFFMGVAGRI